MGVVSLPREEGSFSGPEGGVGFHPLTNRCAARLACDRRQLCADRPDCVKRCSACPRCNALCPDFREEVCPKLAAPPYVCNGCGEEVRCVLCKRYYLHNPAHRNYRDILIGAREGANITEDELLALDALVSPPVKAGQSVHHILANNPDRFSLNEKTVYRYIAGGLLRVKNGDMPRVCMLKPRSRKPVEHKVDTRCRSRYCTRRANSKRGPIGAFSVTCCSLFFSGIQILTQSVGSAARRRPRCRIWKTAVQPVPVDRYVLHS